MQAQPSRNAPRKGKGKGKGKGNGPATAQISDSTVGPIVEELPQYLRRDRITIVEGQFDVAVVSAGELGPTGGIALVGKKEVIATRMRVGCPWRPCAILTTEPACRAGLVGYDSSPILVQLSIPGNDAEGKRTDTLVMQTKFITQLGQVPVELVVDSDLDEITEILSAVRLVLNFSHADLWELEGTEGVNRAPAEIPLTQRHVADYLEAAELPAHAFASINARGDHTATVQVSCDYAELILQMSGAKGVFSKGGEDSDWNDLEVVWLPTAIPRDTALGLVETTSAIGLACKRARQQEARYGLRFKTVDLAQAAAAKVGLQATYNAGAFKLSPVTDAMGPAGLLAMAAFSMKWSEVLEILYWGDHSATILASAPPPKSQYVIRRKDKSAFTITIAPADRTAKRMVADAAAPAPGATPVTADTDILAQVIAARDSGLKAASEQREAANVVAARPKANPVPGPRLAKANKRQRVTSTTTSALAMAGAASASAAVASAEAQRRSGLSPAEQQALADAAAAQNARMDGVQQHPN